VNAAIALSQGSRATRKAIPTLRKALANETTWLRYRAALALARLDPTAHRQIVAMMRGELRQKDRFVRLGVFGVLREIGPSAKDLVPDLINLLRASDTLNDREMHQEAARALGRIGPAAREAVPVLAQAILGSNSDPDVTVIEALGRIGPAAEDALP